MVSPDEAALLIARGGRAKALITSEAYAEAVRDLENYHATALVACRPGPTDRDTRDYHHTMLHALSELHTQLVGYAECAAEVEATLSDPDPQPEDDL